MNADVLPASGTNHLDGKQVPPGQRLADTCRLKGDAPGDGLLRHPRL